VNRNWHNPCVSGCDVCRTNEGPVLRTTAFERAANSA
jgi:hypothetical protein